MDWIALLADRTSRFADAAAAGDLEASVPTCPDWTLADLVTHLGEVHLWVVHAVVHGTSDGDATFTGEPDGLVAWYRDAARQLVDVLSAHDADAPAWTFGPDQVAGFWRRRQVHETVVHEYDALATAGRESAWSIDPALAWDGVDEAATFFYPRQVRLERIAPLQGTVRLFPTDVDAAPLAIGEGDPVAQLTGPSSDLLLALWKRARVEDPVAAGLLRTAITP
ncbi:maleylpyruvate isomerase family mycothiol-dependent enzyme [Nocardioides sp. HM23]|uniref:maleylpyruvate isomerase family mycothiol-dependent enzyme n=1 Tax=Nocardioides bizhenqiangii TaxID=3095076 RepID=UPI002ACA6B25|nr:maleylpyruvate isomerase family mycothiol-dependent enzyme [Nocardioides sp. HM23]MDZ5621382.1 maleylpyruvate isomerase family mycothiol-dependent enzyme [Nocardioides sp. HM23]